MLDVLVKSQGLEAVCVDKLANQACSQRSDEVIAMQEEVPTRGGNIPVYKKLLESEGRFKDAEKSDKNFEEFTFCTWENDKAEEFIALVLMVDFDDANKSILLDPEFTTMGMSYKPHAQARNLI